MTKLLRQRYRKAEERVEAADIEIRRASARRLAELMKLSSKERLAQIDDQILTAEDRQKLRRSIAGSLRHRKWNAPLFISRAVFSKLRSWARFLPSTALVAAVIITLSAAVLEAQKNTYEVIVIPKSIEIDWLLPSGKIQKQVVPAGARLAVAWQSGALLIARRWIEGQGYATAKIDVTRS